MVDVQSEHELEKRKSSNILFKLQNEIQNRPGLFIADSVQVQLTSGDSERGSETLNQHVVSLPLSSANEWLIDTSNVAHAQGHSSSEEEFN